jgi:hypothetical protein
VSPLADVLDVLINDASLPAWNAVPPEVAARDALASADEGDAFVARLAPAITSRSSGNPPPCGQPSEPFLRRGC